MQKIYKQIRIIFPVIITILINSCASSSYSERYGNSATNKSGSSTEEKIEIVEDEITEPLIRVTLEESEYIINKLSNITETNNKKEKFLHEVISYLNTPYYYGGQTRAGIDCSAFTQKVFKNSLNVSIPRTAREQYRTWQTFNDKSELKFGDLIYFDTSKRYFPGHVGIYLDDDLFAHASSSNGVIVSSLSSNYYQSRFVGANRVKITKQK